VTSATRKDGRLEGSIAPATSGLIDILLEVVRERSSREGRAGGREGWREGGRQAGREGIPLLYSSSGFHSFSG